MLLAPVVISRAIDTIAGIYVMSDSRLTVHPLWLRVTHWINALAVVIMVMSGWRIYDANPFMGFQIPPAFTLGGWLAGAIMWHFAAMWLVFVNGIIYLFFNFGSGRVVRKFFPISLRSFATEVSDAVRLRLHHNDPAIYNTVQRVAYLFVWIDITLLVMSGLVLWKSVQFPLLRQLLGGYEFARRIHFIAMTLLVAFFVVHVIMVAIVPKSLVAMFRGR